MSSCLLEPRSDGQSSSDGDSETRTLLWSFKELHERLGHVVERRVEGSGPVPRRLQGQIPSERWSFKNLYTDLLAF